MSVITSGIAAVAQLLSKAGKVAVGSSTGPKTIIAASDPARVNYPTIVEMSLTNFDGTEAVMEGSLTMMAGFYLQAIQLATEAGGIEAANHLDRFNPGAKIRTGMEVFRGPELTHSISTESLKYGLPKKGARPSMEAQLRDSRTIQNLEQGGANMAIGKMFPVVICHGDTKVEVTVSVNLAPKVADTGTVIRYYTNHGDEVTDLASRWSLYKSDLISFSEFLFCTDILRNRVRRAIGDKSGLTSADVVRQGQAAQRSLFTGTHTLADASGLVVITQDTADRIFHELGGRISNYKLRQDAMNAHGTLVIAVVQTDLERVSFYFNGIEAHTDLAIRQLRAQNKNGGDAVDVVKAMMAGRAPGHF